MTIEDVRKLIDNAIPEIQEEWREPLPLPKSERLPVLTFDPETMLPNPLRTFVKDVAYRTQTPVDLVAIPLVIAFSSLLGANYRMHPKEHDDWAETPNLWGIDIAPPGSLKSHCLNEALKPIKYLAAKAQEKFNKESKVYLEKTEEKEEIKNRLNKLLKKAKENLAKSNATKKDTLSIEAEISAYETELKNLDLLNCPTLKRYMTSDSTIEAQQELLKDNPRGLLVERDEIIALLMNFEAKGRESERGFYLSGWNGNGSYSIDRIGRGSTYVPHLCLSLVGTTQPDKVQAYITKNTSALANDGLIQRFQLMVYPDYSKREYVDQHPNEEAKKAVCQIAEIIDRDEFLKNCKTKSSIFDARELLHFHFERIAQETFKKYLIMLEEQIDKEEDRILKEHLSKYRGLIPSLALIFHVITIALTGQDKNNSVTLDMLNMAILWHAYLESHAKRIYGMGDNITKTATESLAKKIKAKAFGVEFSVRDVYSKSLKGIGRDVELAAMACEELETLNWLREISRPGLKGFKYEVNPLLFAR